MSTRPVESPRSTKRWLLPAAALALAPKCLLCLFSYAGIGAALGMGGAEICGAVETPAAWSIWLYAFPATIGPALLGLATLRPPLTSATSAFQIRLPRTHQRQQVSPPSGDG
jgi:hypothetical protein